MNVEQLMNARRERRRKVLRVATVVAWLLAMAAAYWYLRRPS